jgi:hypothetical protein
MDGARIGTFRQNVQNIGWRTLWSVQIMVLAILPILDPAEN